MELIPLTPKQLKLWIEDINALEIDTNDRHLSCKDD